MDRIKLIFLDIDGVLNYVSMEWESGNLIAMPEKDRCGDASPKKMLSKSRIKILNKLTDETGAKIVVSSSWRKVSWYDTAEILVDAGVTGEIIGQTPMPAVRSNIKIFRGNEIYTWMEENSDLLGCHVADFNGYVILDDDSDMLLWQANNFIHCDRHVGLSDQAAYRAKRVLMGLG